MANWYIFLLVSVVSIDWSKSQSEVFKPPAIIEPRIRQDLYYSMYSAVSVNCSADGVPTPTYVWTVNNRPLVPTPEITFDPVTGTLKIPSFTAREQATYVCTATNSISGNRVVSYAAPSRLWQTRAEMMDEGSLSQTVPEHSYLKMQCKKKIVIGSQIRYNWYSAEKTSINLDNNRLFIDLDGNLHFTYVVVNDQQLNYMCGISAAQDRAIILGTRNNVVVTGNSNISPIRPKAVYTNTGVKGMRFSAAKLECMFSGYDPQSPYIPAITWRDDSGKVIETAEPKYVLSDDRRTLTITSLQEEDERTYTCEARNSAGEASAQVFLNVTSGPIFVNGQPADQTVSQYTNVQVNCDTRSASGENPPSPPTWFINGQPWGSQMDLNKFELSPDSKILTIKNVTKPNDIMCVQCNVSNSEDSTLANACLNVLLPIKIEKEPPLEQSIVYGDNLDFTVIVSTDPAMVLSYRWEFNNKIYTGADHPPHMYYNPSTKLAYINTSSLTQEQYGEIGGTYRRVVYHMYEQKVVEINVILSDRQNFRSTTRGFTTGAGSTSEELTTVTHSSPAVRQDFECHLSYMQVFIPAVLVPNSELTLRDPTCKLNNNGTHHKITFAYDECGTVKTVYTDYVDIRNEISVHLILNDTDGITFVEDYTIPLQCSLDRSKILNVAIQVEPREQITEHVDHSADFGLKEYTSAAYSEEITEYPVKVPLNREIFFEINLRNNSNSSIGVYVEQCVATPSPNPNDTTHVTLIDVGCSAHPAVKVQPATEIDRFRFSTQAFRFSGQSSTVNLVYIHCSVSTCGADNCKLPCLSHSRRRRRSARKMTSEILSSGPHDVTS